MAKQHTPSEDRLLVYKHEDDSVDFGMELIDAMRPLYASGNSPAGTDQLAAFLVERFPDNTYRLNPKADCGHYLPVDPSKASVKETLLIDCPGGLGNPFGKSFKHWAYQIIPDQKRLDLLRGYQCSMPNDSLRNAMNDREHRHYAKSFGSRIELFPTTYVDPYDLRKLPSGRELQDDMGSCRIIY